MHAESPTIELWQEVFAASEWLSGLDHACRAKELEVLRRARPEIHSHVVKLLADYENEPVAGEGNGPLTRELASALLEVGSANHSPSLQAGGRFGPYTLERLLGSGGMGEVWLANRADGRYHTDVAIKVLRPELARVEVRERFIREGQIAARLIHPHIARLYDAGATAEGTLYLVFEYVAGERIDRWCDAQCLGIETRVRLFLNVCEAVTQAHTHLIVHRDLKPSNIMVTADGQVKLLDFGIAKLLEADSQTETQTELTRLGVRALTPEYAAPEQVLGETITTVTDVYALGVLLYVLLTGTRPYGPAQPRLTQLEWDVVHAAPRSLAAGAFCTPNEAVASDNGSRVSTPLVRAKLRGTTPAHLRRLLGGDLEQIVNKALKKLPAERYPSVPALAEDLRRYLGHQPVLAQPDAFSYRATKFVRRHRTGVAATVAIFLAVSVGIAGIGWQAQIASAQARRAERVKSLIESVFQATEPGEQEGGVDAAQSLIDRSLERLDDNTIQDPLDRAELYDALAKIETSLGHPREALKLANESVGLSRRSLPPNDPRTGKSLLTRADATRLVALDSGTSDSNSALSDFQNAYLYLKDGGATYNADVGRALAGIAALDSFNGRYSMAASNYKHALALLSTASGPYAKETLRVRLLYAEALARAGSHEEAEHQAREALSEQSSHLPDARDVQAFGDLQLAMVLNERGDVLGALDAASQAVDLSRQLYGPHHGKLADALVTRAKISVTLGRSLDASTDLLEALTIYSPGSARSAEAERFLGLAYVRQKRPADALVHLRNALHIFQTTAPENTASQILTKADIGAALVFSGNAMAGRELLASTLSLATAAFPPSSNYVLYPKLYLSYAEFRCGHPAATEALLRDLLKIRAARGERPNSFENITTRLWLSESMLLEGKAIRFDADGDFTPQMLDIVRADHDAPLLARALRIAANGSVGAERARHFQEAAILLQSEVERLDREIGPTHPDTSAARYLLALTLEDLGLRSADAVLVKGIDALQESDPHHCLLGPMLIEHARLMKAPGARAQSTAVLKQAIAAMKQSQPGDSVFLQTAQQLLSDRARIPRKSTVDVQSISPT